MSLKVLNTAKMSSMHRSAAIDVAARRLLITNFTGSQQEKDFTVPSNCGGLGRIRHFRRHVSADWPLNPLPIDPVAQALGLPNRDTVCAQVFQSSVCNWRCWYCFVDFTLLTGSRLHSEWVTPGQLVDLYRAQPDPPRVIDLTGGQPDLTPEWVPWMIAELRQRGLENDVFLWSDDNLSNDYFWRYLSASDRASIVSYANYARVCCFKGFDATSFTFNTLAEPELFAQQFRLMRELVRLGIDLYGYVTLTTPSIATLDGEMTRFLDLLQEIDENLPLRVVPLQIAVFTPVRGRMSPERQLALRNQHAAVAAWQREIDLRYSATKRSLSISDVPLGPNWRRRGHGGR